MIIKELTNLTNLNWSKTRQSSGTAGSYLKSYSFINGKKVYYKLSFFDDLLGIFGYESFNEIIASNILSQLGYNHLEYNLINGEIIINNKKYQTYLNYSFDFKEKNESKMTFENFYSLNKMENEDVISFSKRFGFINEIYQMIIIDYIIINRDRHGANIEVLYNEKNKKYHLAPIFDNGLSILSPTYKNEEIKKYDIYKNKKVSSFFLTSSLEENILIVPKEMLKTIKIDLDLVFKDLIDILNNDYLVKAKELIKKRIDEIESLCNKE